MSEETSGGRELIKRGAAHIDHIAASIAEDQVGYLLGAAGA